jgi:hypothetical protein
MGCLHSPIVYCQALSRLLHSELGSEAVLYLDDLALFTATFEAHLSLIETVMAKFDSANLRLNPKKCRFCVWILLFLDLGMTKLAFPLSRHVLKPSSHIRLQRMLNN